MSKGETWFEIVVKGERRRAMANRVGYGALVVGVAAVAGLLMNARGSYAQVAQVASDRPAGYVVFPDVEVGTGIDTIIQLTNTATGASTCRIVQCVYFDCTLQERNFFLALSAGQAVGWSAANGADVPLDPACGGGAGVTQPALAAPDVSGVFDGEVKCIEMTSEDGQLLNANDLKGEATIRTAESDGFDVRAYNAIGIQTTLNDLSGQAKRCVGGTDQGDACTSGADCSGGTCETVACLGTSATPEVVCPNTVANGAYAGCPNVLILDHWFDGALNPVTSVPITTDLVLVPCSEDLTGATGPVRTTAQFLVFNEFEQRFSASTQVRCHTEIGLSEIDGGGLTSSIFSWLVQGTLTGQTRIRPVLGNELAVGHGLLGIAWERSGGVVPFTFGSAAFNLNYTGTIGQADTVIVGP